MRGASRRAAPVNGTGSREDGDRPEETRITVMDYDTDRVEELTVRDVRDCRACRDTGTVTWINVEGLKNTALIESVGELFGLHALHLEDIVETSGRPKIEDYGEYILVVLKMLYLWGDDGQIVGEHVSLVLGRNYVISFQEAKGDVFEGIRKLIRDNKGKVRREGADYLAYLLIDAIVDNYFIVMDELGDFVDETEEEVLEQPDRETINDIHELKNQMLFMRKSALPLREILGQLERGDSALVRESTEVHFRDVYDHIVQIIDILDTYRDIVSNMLDTYLSSMSNRLNEIMKVLTIFSTIFIPLTFLASVYGMNLDVLPGRHWPWSYLLFWVVAALLAFCMLLMFKRKHWL
jgi:magnesium transporter